MVTKDENGGFVFVVGYRRRLNGNATCVNKAIAFEERWSHHWSLEERGGEDKVMVVVNTAFFLT